MAITNAIQVRFINDRVRPQAERLIRHQAQLVDLLSTWTATGMNSAIPNDANEVVQDPRPVTLITGADVHLVMARAAYWRDYLAQPFYMQPLYKAAIRDLELIVG